MKTFTLIIVIAVSLSACKSKPTGPVSDRVALNRSYGFSDTTVLFGIMGTQVVTTENIFGRSDPHYSAHSYHAAAMFFDSLENRVFSENVKLNGVSIPSQGINGYITESPESFGATQHWEVTPEDSTVLPYIDDSILAPNLFRITYPRPITDTVSINTGFTIKYEDPGTDSVRIEIFYDSVETTYLFDSTIHHPRGASISMTAANTGSYNVNSRMLSSFPSSGLIQIWVKARRDKAITVSGGKCLLLSTSSARTYCFIKK